MNLLEYAINMELDGAQYYNDQAELNKDNELYNVFKEMAKDEMTHAKILKNKMNEIAFELKDDRNLENVKNIFFSAKDFKTDIKDIPGQIEGYRLILNKEKESIDLYENLLNSSNDEKEREIFKYLIKQEEEHYEIIEDIITLLNHSYEWVESAEFGVRKEEY
ncbi:ferritin family protein [Thermoanaerobacterium sp. R66]|uniref:ferritin-like domain-containing protein n=1 Tax=Thermoanaerobacterium sp. R66 TaxID=2742479 RepID=UPI0023801DAC|nr:ferritin family protein [Thermoanaerobacterium sp. R66]MDE4542148.1 ferritin family protein [Thermoanaerobacterium sp. R66]